jgi:serine/threonine-protein kinase
VGEVVAGKYRLERLLGVGGMAEVYAATNVHTGKRVALKWVLPALGSTEEGRTRFQREAQAAGRIDHPNVVTIFDVVEHQGSLALVMELLHGETLARRAARVGQLPFVEAVALMLPAMRGVAAAHAEGVIHRDLKPDNIFICIDGEGAVRECKVLDFGVSKLTAAEGEASVDITLTGNLVGTPAYMAPEQVRGLKDIDQRVDVYALGVVLYQLLAGRPPFVRDLYSAVMVDIATTDAPPLARFRTDVPRRLAEVVHRALERDLAARFPDVPTFIRALEEAARDDLHLPLATPQSGLVTQLAVPRPGLDPAAATVKVARAGGRPRAAIALAAAVLAAGGLGAWRWRARVRTEAAAPAAAISAAAPVAPVAPVAPSVPEARPPPAPEAPTTPAAKQAAAEPEAPPVARPAAKRRGGRTHRPHAANDNGAAAASSAAAAPARQHRAGKLSVDDF